MGNPHHRLRKISQKIVCLIAIATAIQPSTIPTNETALASPKAEGPGVGSLLGVADETETGLPAPSVLPSEKNSQENDDAARSPASEIQNFEVSSLPGVADETETGLPAPSVLPSEKNSQENDDAARSPASEIQNFGVSSLPGLNVGRWPNTRPSVPDNGNHGVLKDPGAQIKGKPYFDIKRIPGNIEIFPGSVQLFQTYVTNIGTAAWTGYIDDSFTNSFYIKVRNHHASMGKLTRSSRTGSMNGLVVPFLRWEGTLLPGQTLLISYEITVASNAPRGVTFKSVFYGGLQNVSGTCTWGYYTVCQRIVRVQLPPNIQVRRSPGNTTVIPGITETHYIYFTNSSGISWSGFIDEEFSGYENMNIGNVRTTRGNVTRPHASYMRWSGTIGPKQTVTLSYQTTAKQDAAHGSVFKARFYTGLNKVANNCLRDISQCERTTTILIPPRFEVFRTVTSVTTNNDADTTYTITIKNTGGTGASTRGLVETMADKMVYAGVSQETPIPTRQGQKISWPSVYLGAGAQITYQYRAHPSGAAAQDELTSFAVVGDIRGNCTLGSAERACQSTVFVREPANIQVFRSPGNTTIIPGVAETHYIYVTNTGGASWSGFIDEEFTGQENVIIGRVQTTRGNVTRPHPSYMRWSGTIGPGETITVSYQSTAKNTAAHGSVFKARFYTGLNEVANNCLRDISQCERTTTIHLPSKH